MIVENDWCFLMKFLFLCNIIHKPNSMLMKKLLLLLWVAFVGVANADAVEFQWGTPEWNIQDGWTFESYEDYAQEGVVLTYPNPANYTLTFFNIIAVDYLVYKDDVEVPDTARSSAQMNTAIRLSYDFLEGHSYKVVTTKALLAQANIATHTTDTLTSNTDSYSISFSIKGPELVKTIEAEQCMSLSIISQDDSLTFSTINVGSILSALDIPSIEDATIYALQPNDAYVAYEWYGPDYFDGWRDEDGYYTTYYGGYNRLDGHNAYPAVYCIKLNETCDTLKYYYYDYWKEYDPEDEGSQGGIVVNPGKRRVPETHYQNVIWDWDNGDGTVTQYQRFFRCLEGSDYKAAFVVKANNKYVRINATLHFLSIEDYNNLPTGKKGDVNEDGNVDISDIVAIINQIAGTAAFDNADVNEDYHVDISDIVAVINIIAGSE